MFCKLISYCLIGVETIPVDVEIDLSDGLPAFEIVGLPDSTVKESKERVRSAIKNSGYEFPIKRITINLAPGDIKKEGSLYDLPIALGLLCCTNQLSQASLERKLFIGELALDGKLRKVSAIIPMLCSALKNQLTQCIIPKDNANEASILETDNIFCATSLNEVVDTLNKKSSFSSVPPCVQESPYPPLDYKDVIGQEHVKRALMIAAAGYHHTLLIGPPGTGKTMLAKRLTSILPPLSKEEIIEITKIYNIADKLKCNTLVCQRPFRSPHHTTSLHGLIGGGVHPKPGEMTLAHLGVLFLDELLEFDRSSLEILREPMEEHKITLSRSQHTITYPANFLLIASTNPCPCGYYPDFKKCHCDLKSVRSYLGKLSGPLIDRIDIQVETNTVSLADLRTKKPMSSAEIYQKVQMAYSIQKERFKNMTIHYNSELPENCISPFCTLTPTAESLLKDWFSTSKGSLRSYNKILKLSRTIADLDSKTIIDESHIAESLSYRLLDQKLW